MKIEKKIDRNVEERQELKRKMFVTGILNSCFNEKRKIAIESNFLDNRSFQSWEFRWIEYLKFS